MSQMDNVNAPDGTLKAAIFLLSLGEHAAAEVMKEMEPEEVEQIGKVMVELKQIPRDQVMGVLNDFIDQSSTKADVGQSPSLYIENVLFNALGKEKASSVLNQIIKTDEVKGIEALKWMDSRAVVELISEEHPQVIAIILSNLASSKAASILEQLDNADLKLEIVQRIAKLEEIHPSALQELNESLERQIAQTKNTRSPTIDGAKRVANIVNYLDVSTENDLMKRLGKEDKALKATIEDLMFVFDDFAGVDDRAMQELLKDVNTDELMIALKGADEFIKSKFFNNMSSRAAQMLQDDMEAKGPVKLSEVEDAQKKVLATAKSLADEGRISISKGGGDDMVE